MTEKTGHLLSFVANSFAAKVLVIVNKVILLGVGLQNSFNNVEKSKWLVVQQIMNLNPHSKLISRSVILKAYRPCRSLRPF